MNAHAWSFDEAAFRAACEWAWRAPERSAERVRLREQIARLTAERARLVAALDVCKADEARRVAELVEAELARLRGA